jgi:hypothetical protein
MFAHRFRRFSFPARQRRPAAAGFVLLPSSGTGASAVYRAAYLSAFKTVERRVVRRRQVRAAKFISPN